MQEAGHADRKGNTYENRGLTTELRGWQFKNVMGLTKKEPALTRRLPLTFNGGPSQN